MNNDYTSHDFSDGETSEDLVFASMSDHTSETTSASSFIKNETFEEQLKRVINPIKSLKNLCNLANLDEKEYKGDVPSFQIMDLDPLECVVFMVASRYHISLNSECIPNSPLVFAWANMNTITDSEFPSLINSYFKEGYSSMKKLPRFMPIIAPTPEKMVSISKIRHDFASGRIMFHFIGQGFPPLSSEGLIIRNNHNGPLLATNLKNLFVQIHTPSVFIFDCENAALAIDAFKKAEDEMTETVEVAANRFPVAANYVKADDWSDWFCLCATSVGEKLPVDPLIPRDFLSTCILSPVSIAILCHILKYYRTSFNDPAFPLSALKDMLAYEKKDDQKNLLNVLVAVTESVASDYLTPHLFIHFFRREQSVSTLFQRFILAQFLLAEYSVRPISYPYLPNMCHHPLWLQWKTTIDIWITTNLTPSPNFSNEFNRRVIVSFITSMIHVPNEKIRPSIIAAASFVPFSNIEAAHTSLVQIANYASQTPWNRQKLAPVLHFPDLLELFFQISLSSSNSHDMPISTQILEFHALAYILLCALQTDMTCLLGVNKNTDFSKLLSALFNKTIPQSTRTHIAAVISYLQRPFETARQICSTQVFLSDINVSLQQSNPSLAVWLLMLLKRTYLTFSMDESLFIPMSLHLQVAGFLFHNSPEVRAGAISALSIFCQGFNSPITSLLVFSSLPLLFDISTYVRNQLLLFFIRALVSINAIQPEYFENRTPFSTLSSVFQWFYPSYRHFSEYIDVYENFLRAAEKSSRSWNSLLPKVLCFAIDYMCYDPVMLIKDNANRAKSLFISNKSPSQIASQFGIPFASSAGDRYSKAAEENAAKLKDFPSDSDALFNCFSSQLVRSAHWQPPECFPSTPSRFKNRTDLGSCNVIPVPNYLQLSSHSKVQSQTPLKITFKGNDLVIASSNKQVYLLNEGKISSKICLSESDICDLHSIDDIVLACTTDGCVHLWSPERSERVSFRASVSYRSQSALQLAAPSVFRTSHIATTRGVASGVALWDIESQKLVGEWSTFDQFTGVSAITMHHAMPEICVIGSGTGSLATIDFRQPQEENAKSILSVQIGDKIIRIGGYRESPRTVFAGTAGGKCLSWDSRNNKVSYIGSRYGQLCSFETHPLCPVLMCATTVDQPFLLSPSGTILLRALEVGPGALIASHKSEPTIAFACPSGDFFMFNMQNRHN